MRLTGTVSRKKKAGGTGYHRSYFVHLEVLLISFLKKRTLPDDWGINESVRFIQGLFLCHMGWNPTILSLPAIPGIPAYVPESVPTVPGDSPMVRFANLYSRAPDFTIDLLAFVRKKHAYPSLMDRVVLMLRQIPSVEYKRKGYLTDAELDELNAMLRGPFLNWPSESPLLERVEKIPCRELEDGELAQQITEILQKEKVTAEMVREARRRMQREDQLRKERFSGTAFEIAKSSKEAADATKGLDAGGRLSRVIKDRLAVRRETSQS